LDSQLGIDRERIEDHQMPLEQERERGNRLCKHILAETGPETFEQLTRDLDELLEANQKQLHSELKNNRDAA
jgi:hypothetical protein